MNFDQQSCYSYSGKNDYMRSQIVNLRSLSYSSRIESKTATLPIVFKKKSSLDSFSSISSNSSKSGSIGRKSLAQKIKERFGNKKIDNSQNKSHSAYEGRSSAESHKYQPISVEKDSCLSTIKTKLFEQDKYSNPGISSYSILDSRDSTPTTLNKTVENGDNSHSSSLVNNHAKTKSDLSGKGEEREISFRQSYLNQLPEKSKIENNMETNYELNGNVEYILKLIDAKKLDCVALLEQLRSKARKDVEFHFKDVKVNQSLQVQCMVTLDGEILRVAKDSSRESAKLKAAENSIKTLLTENGYTKEKAILLSFI